MSLNIGKTALYNSQIALDLVGKNIAHANDPSYSRQRLHISSTVSGNVVNRIEQAVNDSLQKDILREQGQLSYFDKQKEILLQIESSINELSDADISSSLDDYYSSLESLSLDPHDVSLRKTVLQSAQQVTDSFHLVANSFLQLSQRIDQEISDHADVINNLLDRISSLNVEVARREGGVNDSPAVDIRDQRTELLNELSNLMNITTSELSNGSVLVQSEGRTLVFQGEDRGVYIDRTDGFTRLRYTSDNSYVEPKGGSLGGLIDARDNILNPRIDELNQLAAEFAWQSNLVHNTGRGLEGLTSVTAQTKIDPNFVERSLDIAVVDALSTGNQFKPTNGTLTIQLRNEISGDTTEASIDITLIGDNKMSLQDLSDQLQQVNHLDSSVDNFGRLHIDSESGYSFFIKEDTSNVSSFLGLNNLFSGNDAATININSDIIDNVSLFAAAKSEAPGDNSNLISLIQAKQNALDDGQTLTQHYSTYVSSIASETNRFTALASNQDRIVTDVTERRNSFSGVNLDEEAANLLRFQQAYQAAAQYLSVQNELLTMLFQTL